MMMVTEELLSMGHFILIIQLNIVKMETKKYCIWPEKCSTKHKKIGDKSNKVYWD